MKFIKLYLVALNFLLLTKCRVEEYGPADSIKVSYFIPNPHNYVIENQLRYTVLWSGPEVEYFTHDGVVPTGEESFSFELLMPSEKNLEKIYSDDYFKFSYRDENHRKVVRPRIILYDDLNGNKQFDDSDYVVAIDGLYWGDNHYFVKDFLPDSSDKDTRHVSALVDLENFFKELSIEETNKFYELTNQKYTGFLKGRFERTYSEDGYINVVYSNEIDNSGILPLYSGTEKLLRTDLKCFRKISFSSGTYNSKILVDNRYDEDFFCAGIMRSCTGIDMTQEPDFNEMKNKADLFTIKCAMASSAIMEAHQSFLECKDCSCSLNTLITTYYTHEDSLPAWWPCPND